MEAPRDPLMMSPAVDVPLSPLTERCWGGQVGLALYQMEWKILGSVTWL